MPIVRVELFPGRSDEVKAELARELTATFERVASIPAEATTILFSEVRPQEWFVAGKSYASKTASE